MEDATYDALISIAKHRELAWHAVAYLSFVTVFGAWYAHRRWRQGCPWRRWVVVAVGAGVVATGFHVTRPVANTEHCLMARQDPGRTDDGSRWAKGVRQACDAAGVPLDQEGRPRPQAF